MAANYDFVQLDVFTQTPLAGNLLIGNGDPGGRLPTYLLFATVALQRSRTRVVGRARPETIS
jgi:hypothetical protein